MTIVRRKTVVEDPAAVKIMGKLCNRNNYPVSIAYLNDTIQLAPRMTLPNVDQTQCGSLPIGVEFVKYQ